MVKGTILHHDKRDSLVSCQTFCFVPTKGTILCHDKKECFILWPKGIYYAIAKRTILYHVKKDHTVKSNLFKFTSNQILFKVGNVHL